LDNYVNYTWASFLHQQFGVQTLVDYSALYGRVLSSEGEDKDQSGPYAVHTLTDQETIAKLAVGVRRFDLPAEYNFILIFKALLEDTNGGYAGNAAQKLAQIY
jgi:hypothetical protein